MPRTWWSRYRQRHRIGSRGSTDRQPSWFRGLHGRLPRGNPTRTITSSVTIRELFYGLADAVGRASYGHERVQITNNGKPAAVLIGPEDSELLEQLEMLRDVTE